MTIGIAASGPDAGDAVYAAVLGAELLGRGAIGGFAVFAVLDEHHAVRHCVTQRGGITALDIPQAWRQARIAAAISSGPDRPEPLVQFLPGQDGVGLVTGHRLPNQAGRGGIPLNSAALALMARGQPPQAAVDTVLALHPEMDAGLVAINVHGEIGQGNSVRVARRNDLGRYRREEGSTRLAFLHNSIYARDNLAVEIADLAWAHLSGQIGQARFLALSEPVPMRHSDKDRVFIDAAGTIVALDTSNPNLPTIDRRSTAIYLATEVWRGERHVGRVHTELYADIRQGTVYPAKDASSNTVLMRLNDVAS